MAKKLELDLELPMVFLKESQMVKKWELDLELPMVPKLELNLELLKESKLE
jgi:hypothetical protein